MIAVWICKKQVRFTRLCTQVTTFLFWYSRPDKGKRCEFLPPVDEPERLEEFRDHALSQVHSIDDLEDLGRDMKVCPYYGSRKAIKQAQLVTLPYNLLLQKQARESFGISLEKWVRRLSFSNVIR